MKLRVAGAQIPVTKDVRANEQAISRALDFASAEGADVLLTPEGSLSGYYAEFDPGTVAGALAEITARARDLRIALALGTCFVEPDDQRCYNQLRFYEKDGTYLGFHSKILRCGTVVGPPTGELDRYAESPLRTFDLGGLTVGGLICNDLWANPCCTPMPDPHLTQQLARLGARVIFHAVNGGRSDSEFSGVAWHYHESNLLIRANAAAAWIVVADNCLPAHFRCSTPCGVVAPDGTWATKTPPKGEQMFAYTIPLDT